MKNRLLENLSRDIKHQIPTRRYNLADIISESYKLIYHSEEGSNMKRLAESHLKDVKENPRDLDKLSRNLCIVKELSKLVESGELKDEDLVAKENHDTVDPKKERVIVKTEECNECDDPKKKELKESVDDSELTDEELEELTKHLETIRKERKNAPKKEVEESATPRRGIKCKLADAKKESLKEDGNPEKYVSQYSLDLWDTEGVEDVETKIEMALENSGIRVLGCQPTGASWSASEYEDMIGMDIKEILGESKKEETVEECNKSKSYKGLSNFKKQSESKAFYKTFKKMHESLKEGKALTRQESIDLYKASNSALTQLSIELEHNPEFLSTFKESVSLLSKDVASLLESLTKGKAPSKKTMRSLSKFSESLLYEAEDEETEDAGEIPEEGDFDAYADDSEDFVGDDEGDISSEESDEFDQEYADARVELHKDLADKFEDEEDPEVQDKLSKDADEVTNLPGITDEQVAEITGEEVPVESDEDTPDDDEIEDEEDDSEITDDELEELKKHLKEMRAARKEGK